ncbi:MAG: hypothetical protein P4L22_00825 [Candidatus Babeliales bacterium]|nr:hypothetical protein [Candidatus Babeliales bacterium]
MKQARLLLMLFCISFSINIKSNEFMINGLRSIYKLLDTKTQTVVASGTLLAIVKFLRKTKVSKVTFDFPTCKGNLRRSSASLNLVNLPRTRMSRSKSM